MCACVEALVKVNEDKFIVEVEPEREVIIERKRQLLYYIAIITYDDFD